MVSTKGLSVSAVLAALYNNSHAIGMGMLHYDPAPMTEEQAAAILDENGTRFDYLKGRVMKVNLAGTEFDERLYDRDIGAGAARAAVDALRSKQAA